MKRHLRSRLLGLWCLCVLLPFLVCRAADPEHVDSLSLKSDNELVGMLEETNAARRLAAVSGLSARYRRPGTLLIHSKHAFQEAVPIDRGVPDEVVRGMYRSAKDDPDFVVQLVAVDGMRRLLARTNILDLYATLLDSTNGRVSLRVAEDVAELAEQQREPFMPRVLDALKRHFGAQEQEDVVLQALKCAGQLGSGASSLASQVARLTEHPSRRVRSEARRVLKMIK